MIKRLSILFFLIFLWCSSTWARTYTTSFPNTQNPISEGGNWVNGQTVGLDWKNAQTTPGFVFGGQGSLSSQYDDTVALVAGSWGADQTVTATVRKLSPNSSYSQEVELRLRSSLSAHSCTGYEILFSVVGAGSQIVRWNGAIGNFTILNGTGPGVSTVNNGDVISASIIGSQIRVYLNGNQIDSVVDSTYSSGSPGLGFFTRFGDNNQFGMTSFTAQDSAVIPPGTGWYQIPNTAIRPVCSTESSIQGSTGCDSVTLAWNSGVLDSSRHRFILWGGGHGNYSGNEMYAISLNGFTPARITEPGLPPSSDCAASIVSGTQANSRHTYDGIAYMANVDKMFVFGGSKSPCGYMGNDTWLFNFGTNLWQRNSSNGMDPSGPIPHGVPGIVSAYDPNTGLVFIHDDTTLYSYNASTNAYTQRSSAGGVIDYHMTAAVDPVTKRFVIIGGGQAWWYDIANGSSYTRQTLSQTGGSTILSQSSPGLAYDTIGNRLVAWHGGNSVYLYNWGSSSWSSQTFTGGPGAAIEWGTFDRWQWDSVLGVFLSFNDVDNNLYSLRLSAQPTDTTAPTIPTNLSANAVSSSQINLSWTVSTDDVGVAGYNIYRDGSFLGTSATNSYSNSGLTASTNYTYAVSAYDAAGNTSAQSSSASATTQAGDVTAPSIPTNLSATAISSSQINLTWTASTDNVAVTGYKIYRAGSQIGVSATNSYSNTGLSANTTYSYTVSSYDAAGNNSSQSSSALATTLTGAPTSSNSFQIVSTSTGTFPFTVGIPCRKGDIPNYPVLSTSGINDFQVDVKRRWNDGSVKHAIASGQTDLTANVLKTIAVSNSVSAPGGTPLTSANIQSAAPSASVQLGAIGTVNLSSLLASPVRTWISGPEMVECHYRSNVGSDATLSVWFYVRLYKAGRIRISAVVENGYINVTDANKSYVPTVIVGGTTVYNNGGAALSHYAHTRWTAEGWIGGNPAVTPKHNSQYLMDTKLVPNYWKRNPSAAALNALTQTYSPMSNGALTANMHDTGFQNQIGLLPLWDALYVTSTDARAYNASLNQSSAFNSYAIAWRDPATQRPAQPTLWPNYSLGTFDTTAGSLIWEFNHMPSEGYLAYMISGDYWHYETLLFHVTLNYLARNGSGLNRILTGETRGTSWALRNMTQLAGIFPTGDAVGAEYQTLLSNNINNWVSVIAALPSPNIGDMYEYGNPYGNGWIASWQQNFMDQSVGMGYDLEPLASMTNYITVRDFLYKFPVGLLGPQGGYYFGYAGQYNIDVSSQTTNLNPAQMYQTWAEVWTASVAAGFASAVYDNALHGSSGANPANASSGYWGNLLPAIVLAVDHGATGAAAAWARLIGATNWTTLENSGFDNVPIWGTVPRDTVVVTPSPPLPPANLRKVNN